MTSGRNRRLAWATDRPIRAVAASGWRATSARSRCRTGRARRSRPRRPAPRASVPKERPGEVAEGQGGIEVRDDEHPHDATRLARQEGGHVDPRPGEEEVVDVARGHELAAGAAGAAEMGELVALEVEVRRRAQPVLEDRPAAQAVRGQPGDRRMRVDVAVAMLDLHEQRGLLREDPLRSREDLDLVALDVALDERHAAAGEVVGARDRHRDGLDVRAELVPRVVEPAHALVALARDHGDHQVGAPAAVAERDRVHRQVRSPARHLPQPREVDGVRLEGVHRARGADELEQPRGEVAAVGADVHRGLTSTDNLVDDALHDRSPGGRAPPAQPLGQQRGRPVKLTDDAVEHESTPRGLAALRHRLGL